MIVARQGLGNMAVSNALGGNVFNIFMGLGLPWTLYTLLGSYEVDRADFNDPVESFLDMDLFSPHLIRQRASGGANGEYSDNTGSSSGSFSLPFPTGAFWTNLVVQAPDGNPNSFPVAVYPFAYRWSSSSLQVSYPASQRVIGEKQVVDL